MQLSKRLNKVASFVTKGNRLADVGTDHGYIPIYLVENGTVPTALAMDINKGPLERAKEHISEYGLEDKIETRLSDGLQYLGKGEADTVLIAGMGGALTVKILENGREVLSTVKELILSPHSEINLVRKYIISEGYKIVKEDMVFDAGKYYTVIKAEKTDKGPEKYSEAEEMYGKFLCYRHNVEFKDFIDKEHNMLSDLYNNLKNNSSESAVRRLKEVGRALELNRIIREGNDCRCQK